MDILDRLPPEDFIGHPPFGADAQEGKSMLSAHENAQKIVDTPMEEL
jgi:hypothetical protein